MWIGNNDGVERMVMLLGMVGMKEWRWVLWSAVVGTIGGIYGEYKIHG